MNSTVQLTPTIVIPDSIRNKGTVKAMDTLLNASKMVPVQAQACSETNGLSCFGDGLSESKILKESNIPLMKKYILKYKSDPERMRKLAKHIFFFYNHKSSSKSYAKNLTDVFIMEMILFCCQYAECLHVAYALTIRAGISCPENFIKGYVKKAVKALNSQTGKAACTDVLSIGLGLFLADRPQLFKEVYMYLMKHVGSTQLHKELWMKESEETSARLVEYVKMYAAKPNFLRIFLVYIFETVPWSMKLMCSKFLGSNPVVTKVFLSILDGMPEYVQTLDDTSKRIVMREAAKEGVIGVIGSLVQPSIVKPHNQTTYSPYDWTDVEPFHPQNSVPNQNSVPKSVEPVQSHVPRQNSASKHVESVQSHVPRQNSASKHMEPVQPHSIAFIVPRQNSTSKRVLTRFSTVDVKGDGSCFFRAIYKSAKLNGMENISQLVKCHTTEDDFVVCLRKQIASFIRTKDPQFLKDIFNNWWELRKENKDRTTLRAVFDLQPAWYWTAFKLVAQDDYAQFKYNVIRAVQDPKNYVGEIEVVIVSELLNQVGISLSIIDNVMPINPQKNTIYVVNKDNVHYLAVKRP